MEGKGETYHTCVYSWLETSLDAEVHVTFVGLLRSAYSTYSLN
jgi:hypothetical protein